MKKNKDATVKAWNDFPGYPVYAPNDDIYNKNIVENLYNGSNKDTSQNDLDVPGSELDDAQEEIGSEDEENNYYSIGGDNHGDLEEDKPEVD